MIVASLPGLAIPVARIILGTAAIGAPFVGSRQKSRLFDYLTSVLDSGGNAFDTARVYRLGWSERLLGEWMAATGCRDKVVVITKGGHPGLLTSRSRLQRGLLRHDLEQSLRALGTDHVDLYLLHRDDPRVPVSVIMESLSSLRVGGSIQAYGVSNWTHGRIEAANRFARSNGIPELAASSPQFSLAEWRRPPWPGCVSISGEAGSAARAWYSGSGVAVLAWSSLAAGLFALPALKPGRKRAASAYVTSSNEGRLQRARQMAQNKGVSPAQVALAYLVSQPFTVFPVVSTGSLQRFRENAEASGLRLTAAEMAWLESGGMD